jgi:anti-sigma factor RsiW
MPDHWSEQLSAYLDDDLSSVEREALGDHLRSCESCRAALEEMRRVAEWAASFPGRKPEVDAWPEIEARIAEDLISGSKPERKSSFWGTIAAGLAALTPAVGTRWAGFAKTAAITGLVGISLFGMGRSLYLERMTDSLERKASRLDLELASVATGMIWHRSAQDLRDQVGKGFQFNCPSYGEPDAVWGTGEYTDDSSVCNAAVHEGWITHSSGGTVTIKITPGRDWYPGTSRNGVESREWEEWAGSFVVVQAEPWPEPSIEPNVRATVSLPVAIEADPEVTVDLGFSAEGGVYSLIGWDDTAIAFRGWTGTRIGLMCPGGSRGRTVWGSGPYTDDSSICTAAVHAGLITLAEGGRVVIDIGPRFPDYRGTSANGVETLDWEGGWSGSFTFREAEGLR